MRPFGIDDVDALHAHWTLPPVRKYLWDDMIISREQVVEVVESSLDSFAKNGWGFWSVFPKEKNELIGFCGFRFFGAPPEIEVLYSIAPDYAGRGLATEAKIAMLRRGFEENQLVRIYAGADPSNMASFRVMGKCGMTFAKRVWLNNIEVVYYVITKAAFQPDHEFSRLSK